MNEMDVVYSYVEKMALENPLQTKVLVGKSSISGGSNGHLQKKVLQWFTSSNHNSADLRDSLMDVIIRG